MLKPWDGLVMKITNLPGCGGMPIQTRPMNIPVKWNQDQAPGLGNNGFYF